MLNEEIEQFEGQEIDGGWAFILFDAQIRDEIDHTTSDHEISALAESIDAELAEYNISIMIGDLLETLTDYRDSEYHAAINEAAYQLGTTGEQNLFETMPA